MMTIRELVALDAEPPPPVAADLAAHWGWTELQFFRSSDNHVFRCSGPAGAGFLRFTPEWHRSVEEHRRTAATARALVAAGASVSVPVATHQAADVAVTTWEGTTYSGSSWTDVAGEFLDSDDLSPQTAQAWGGALGRLHTAGRRLGGDEPGGPEIVDALRAAADDGQVSAPIRNYAQRLVETLSQLPGDAKVVGMIHGDPELDNLCWAEGLHRSPVWIDLDHYTSGWFAADICFALRDLAQTAEPPDPGHPLVAAFLRGYGQHRSVPAEEFEWWPHFAAAHAVLTVGSISRALGELDPRWPDWAVRLHRRLVSFREQTEGRLGAKFGGQL